MHLKVLVFFVVGTLAGALQGCVEAEAHKTSIVAQEDQRVAGIGDAVLSAHGTERSPNARGDAGATGGAGATGTTTFYFAGANAGKALFVRRDVLVQIGQTTINPNSRSYFDQQGGAIPYSGVASVNAYPIVVPPNLPHHRIVSVHDQKVTVAMGKSIVLSGRTLTVINASANQLTFALQ